MIEMIETWIANHPMETFRIIFVLIALLFWTVWGIWSLKKESVMEKVQLIWQGLFEKHLCGKSNSLE